MMQQASALNGFDYGWNLPEPARSTEGLPAKKDVLCRIKTIRRMTGRIETGIRRNKITSSADLAGLLAESRYLLEKAERQVRQDELDCVLYHKITECQAALYNAWPDESRPQTAAPAPILKLRGQPVKYALLFAAAYAVTAPFALWAPAHALALFIIPTVMASFMTLVSAILDAVIPSPAPLSVARQHFGFFHPQKENAPLAEPRPAAQREGAAGANLTAFMEV